ncbi:hypothetical protein JMN32_08340 [Fulvivirga sp. 29W222]|uniref:Uncharacterized protein n=1 Tax=Fulvivirga marina TaxID=2494733 RepID=A0A937KBN6_9BACT|nr:hypothetical protein [Fulvivirga marina]MBL6446314.1 hypothetical protein [Fulvivirga marina]
MRKAKLLIFMLFLVPIAAISQQHSDISKIGRVIDNEMAKSWIETFKSKNPDKPKGFTYGKVMLQEMLSAEGVKGIRISYGLTESGTFKFILNGTDNAGGKIWSFYNDGSACPPYCPEEDPEEIDPRVVSIGNKISDEMANNWMEAYTTANPGELKSHLYGKALAEEILAQEKSAGIYFARGLSADEVEHLVLIAVNENGELMIEGVVGNRGNSCPPCPEEIDPSTASSGN